MKNYSQSFAACINDELTDTSEALDILRDYANNGRTIQSHNVDSDTPRLTLATSEGNVISIWPTLNKTFSVEIAFEDDKSKNGRFRACFHSIDIKEIEVLVTDNWQVSETLRSWQPN